MSTKTSIAAWLLLFNISLRVFNIMILHLIILLLLRCIKICSLYPDRMKNQMIGRLGNCVNMLQKILCVSQRYCYHFAKPQNCGFVLSMEYSCYFNVNLMFHCVDPSIVLLNVVKKMSSIPKVMFHWSWRDSKTGWEIIFMLNCKSSTISEHSICVSWLWILPISMALNFIIHTGLQDAIER